MAWIKSQTVLLRHRKLAEFAKALRLKPVYAMGHLHALWHAAMEQQEDGILSSWSDDFIAESSGVTSDAQNYVRLLHEFGWLDNKVIHDWLDYAGSYLTSKYKSNNKQRLVDIWRAHGRDYGTGSEEEVNRKEIGSPRLDKTRLEDSKENSKDKDGAGKFVPPSPQEVSEYGKTIGFPIDGEKFVAFYQASGWYRGRSKIKDWKAAVVTWKRKNNESQNIPKPIQKPQDLDAMLKLQGLV